jgi:hypothetical protein
MVKHYVVLSDRWKRDRNGDMDNSPAPDEYFSSREAAEAWVKREGWKICNVRIVECNGKIPDWV